MTIDEYILQHIDPEGEYLHALYRDTHLKLLYPRMASGHLQGRMLKMFVRMIRPRQVLEIGTYSGYSALCIAEGLPEGSLLHTFEINDEQEDFTRPWLEGSSYADRIKFYIGDALKRVPELGLTFDMVFMDGDKRKYVDYYEMALSVLSPGGYILADNTLWDGHVLEERPRMSDLQTLGIQAFNGFAVCTHYLGLGIDLKAAHRVVHGRRHDRSTVRTVVQTVFGKAGAASERIAFLYLAEFIPSGHSLFQVGGIDACCLSKVIQRVACVGFVLTQQVSNLDAVGIAPVFIR